MLFTGVVCCLMLFSGPDEDVASVKVTRQAVGKENMRGSQFTFWSWFYQARELIVNCLKKEWCAG